MKKHVRYCGSTEKCRFTPCIAVFSALSCVAPFFSALNVGPAALYGHSTLHGPAAHFQRQSHRTEKCHFTPCITIFSVLKTSIFLLGKDNIPSDRILFSNFSVYLIYQKVFVSFSPHIVNKKKYFHKYQLQLSGKRY